MAEKAREAMDQGNLTVVADHGYCKGEEILACLESGITPYVPKPMTSGSTSKLDLQEVSGSYPYVQKLPGGE